MDKPRWLDDEPEILALLGRFLDKLDRRPAGDWQQPPTLPVDDRHLPGLFRHDSDADQLWTLLKSLDGQLLDIHLDRKRGRYDAEYHGARLRLILAAEETLRDWLQRPRVTPYTVDWRAAVERHAHAFADGGAALLARPIVLAGHDAGEIVAAFANLATPTNTLLSLRQLSARGFWGLSKFLDDREELLAALFPALVLQPRPIVVNVLLPARIEGVLFIENQDSYTRAVAGIPPQAGALALVYASGFRGSAQRIREPEGVSLHYHGDSDARQRDAFTAWWFARGHELPAWFWGDLDYSGLAILKALRGRFGEVRAWQPGYQPMLELARAGGGHRRDIGDKTEQAHPGATGCAYADQVLLPAIAELGVFVDQEAV